MTGFASLPGLTPQFFPAVDRDQFHIEIDLPADLPPAIGGPLRLQQVLVNLLTNAADAVEGRPERRIRLTAAVAPDRIRLDLADSGPGVPPALATRIFDPFFSSKEVGKGLGLGLSISYNIVKDFGGNLYVSDEVRTGAVFSVELRRADIGESLAA